MKQGVAEEVAPFDALASSPGSALALGVNPELVLDECDDLLAAVLALDRPSIPADRERASPEDRGDLRVGLWHPVVDDDVIGPLELRGLLPGLEVTAGRGEAWRAELAGEGGGELGRHSSSLGPDHERAQD